MYMCVLPILSLQTYIFQQLRKLSIIQCLDVNDNVNVDIKFIQCNITKHLCCAKYISILQKGQFSNHV